MAQQQYTLPSLVGLSVMFVDHNRLGASAVNRRLTRSAGVMTCPRRPSRFRVSGIPRNPVREMTRATWSHPMQISSPLASSAWTRRTP